VNCNAGGYCKKTSMEERRVQLEHKERLTQKGRMVQQRAVLSR